MFSERSQRRQSRPGPGASDDRVQLDLGQPASKRHTRRHSLGEKGLYRDSEEHDDFEYGDDSCPPRLAGKASGNKLRKRQAAGHAGVASAPATVDSVEPQKSHQRRSATLQTKKTIVDTEVERNRGPAGGGALAVAARAAAIEAFRVRRHPGPWIGEKGGRVASAAVLAAAIDMVLQPELEDKPRRRRAVATAGSLLATRAAYGPVPRAPRQRVWM